MIDTLKQHFYVCFKHSITEGRQNELSKINLKTISLVFINTKYFSVNFKCFSVNLHRLPLHRLQRHPLSEKRAFQKV